MSWSKQLSLFLVPGGGERVLGTYLYPRRHFTRQSYQLSEYDMTEVIRTVGVRDFEILVTRNGGLFVRPPADLFPADPDPHIDEGLQRRQLAFQDDFVSAVHVLQCELAFEALVSEPASPVHATYCGKLVDNHALVTGAGGGREPYYDRTLGPLEELRTGTYRTNHTAGTDIAALDRASSVERAKLLAEVAPALPGFVAGAYSLFSRRQSAEALLDAWIVIEQILNSKWREHVSAFARNGSHRDRLKDHRSYSASVQAEVLLTAGKLPPDLYEDVQSARKSRNDLAHGAKVSLEAVQHCMNAMKRTIEFVCGRSIYPPSCQVGVSFSYP